MDSSLDINPWSVFKLKDSGPNITGVDTIIDNRFPNNFTKYSSLVTCNFCNVIILKNQTQQHFKIHHNKKFKKKFSRFKIPFNAVEGYDLICELRRTKLATSNLTHANKTKEMFKLKHKHSDITLSKPSNKTPSKIVKKIQKKAKVINAEENISLKISMGNESSLVKCNEITAVANDENVKVVKKSYTDIKNELKTGSRKVAKRSILTSANTNNKRSKSSDIKLNIRVNSDGLLTSTIKGEANPCSNIFERISHFCDNNITSKANTTQITTPGRGVIKQSGFDESYGCSIFTDEFNNSILIDNDKDEPDDFDCCESSLSNDSAYFSLPNTTGNSGTTTNGKLPNLTDSSVAPPLVTAYQYSNSSNKVSYCTNESQSKGQSKSTPMTMHVTRSLSYNSIVPPKSTVKHRFYVSGHSNQTIINTLRRKCNINSDMNFLMENETDEGIMDIQANGILHSLSKESQDHSYFENHKSSSYQSLKHSVNSRSYSSGIKDINENRFWKLFEENGLNVSTLIPKRLKWIQSRARTKSLSQLNIVRTKPSPKTLISKQPFVRNCEPGPVTENPLLTSYTIDVNSIDDVFHSDPLLTSEIVLDYQYPDRNQMSFQQRLLERGVISQRDIARSQRCLSFSVNGNSRKNSKANPVKSNVIDYNRISVNKNYPIKTQVVCRPGYNSAISNSCNFNKIKPAVIHQSTSIVSHDAKVNFVQKHVVANRRQSWRDDVNMSRIQNVLSFPGQCLSQSTKYINRDSKITISPRQNRNSGMSALTRTLDGRIAGSVFPPSQLNSGLLHSNNSAFNPILSAQNTFTNDSNRFSQRQMEGQYVHLASNNNIRSYKKADSDFMNYHQSYEDINSQSIVPQSNYQTMYNPQMKFANHSTTIYNSNFEL